MKTELESAFRGAGRGYSQDRVVADPELNAIFLQGCRALGLNLSDRELNRALLNLRKAGHFKGEIRSRRTLIFGQDEFRFASEVAVRHLERRESVTLDDVICDPELAREFDAIASEISPGRSSLEYRWAALGLRKRGGLKPELLQRFVTPEGVQFRHVKELNLHEIPRQQGLYVFFDNQQTLYVGETTNLRHRIGKHLDHSDRKGLAQWLWSHGISELHLEIHLLPDETTSAQRKALEIDLIRSRNSLFNELR